ncbi:MAG: quinolinate synthase NadA [Candidatus Nitricoxidivorans perseverans]|uniref:Quinolinate synthase n=1 Tax=Candidatus Nitricoxidivorans perseverans TaxID=2975601 RepID=A0AA49ITI6_9PROT|nr:MAG: quinolinate synthase NadA [Candidatus Nitricoxidivorans perseverans]
MHPIPFDRFNALSDREAEDRIIKARARLGKRAVILCHHYQRADVYRHADITGDSLKLSRLASQTEAEYIVFCGVHFMAEVADILSRPEQVSILPDLAAGCSMADMASLAKVERCWRELSAVCNPDETVTPVTYINSAADLKAFCGEHGGIVCTSSNAPKILQWSFARRPKVLFFPDQHLGRWSAHQMGIPMDEMVLWNPDLEMGGLSREQIEKAKIILWHGYCSVHQMFQPSQIEKFRAAHPEGKVISHPECSFEVCQASDAVGSTETIIRTVKESAPGTRWIVGTELNLVDRLAGEVKAEGKTVEFMGGMICMCSTMQRIDPQHLAWCLENLAEGHVVNRISVPEHEAKLAKIALERMLDAS